MLAKAASDKNAATEFTKMSGAGNDFIVIDDRGGRFGDDVNEMVRRICTRRLSVGADGVLFLRPSRRANLRVEYYNADGGRAAFCANGTRCAARFAFANVLATAKLTLETDWAVIAAEVAGERVTLQLPEISGLPRSGTFGADRTAGEVLVVGVPHLVTWVDDAAAIDVDRQGAALRRAVELGPDGANVSFVQPIGQHEAAIRSFERGVEGETLSCGSGVVAAALIGFHLGRLRGPAVMHTKSGIPLEVSANVNRHGFDDVRLTGDARVIYRAKLGPETLAGFPLPRPPHEESPR